MGRLGDSSARPLKKDETRTDFHHESQQMRLILTFFTYLLLAPLCMSVMELDRWDGGERVPGDRQ
jgi:hypothetical protein